MLEESIRKWNPWWADAKELNKLKGTDREQTKEMIKALAIPHIKDVIGVRRSGKTTSLYQIILHMITNKAIPKDIIFLNFDDAEINAASFEDLTNAIKRINPDVQSLFLDEIQQKKGWERWLRTIYDTKIFKQIFISGSSASLLSQDIGRVLTGRHITFTFFPYSFKEYLKVMGWTNFSYDFLKYNKNRLLHHMTEYLLKGGFPEVTGKDSFERNTILTNLYNDILARDITSRFNASYDIARNVSYYLLSNIANEFSFRSVAKNTGLSVETVEKYIGFLEESFMVMTLNVFSYKIKTQFKQNKKIYCIDMGLRNAISFKFSEDTGRLMENLVFIELKRRQNDIYYWKNGIAEVDFVINEGTKVKEVIQVCWDVKDSKTKDREVKGLLEAMKFFRLNVGMIITEDYEAEETIEGKSIKYVPLWKWLL